MPSCCCPRLPYKHDSRSQADDVAPDAHRLLRAAPITLVAIGDPNRQSRHRPAISLASDAIDRTAGLAAPRRCSHRPAGDGDGCPRGRIWLAGGLSPLGEALTDVDIFDPATAEWSEGPSLPTGIHHAALVSDGARLMLIGGYLGRDPSLPTAFVLVLDEGADEWREGPALPDARGAGAAAFDGSRIVFAGGVGTNGLAFSDVFALDGDAWERIGAMAGPVSTSQPPRTARGACGFSAVG